jgi:Cu/Ag efflux protein CusF
MKKNFKTLTIAALAASFALNVWAVGGEAILNEVETEATVQKIDYKTRELTLKDDDGEVFDIVADEDVKNFSQIKKGDVVTAAYAEAIVYDINPNGGKATAPKETVQAEQARPGDKPAAAAIRQVSATVKITNIDRKEPSVTFKGASGESQTIKVQHPEKLDGVKVGDSVDLTYTEALAVKIDKKMKQ